MMKKFTKHSLSSIYNQ